MLKHPKDKVNKSGKILSHHEVKQCKIRSTFSMESRKVVMLGRFDKIDPFTFEQNPNYVSS